MSKKLDEKETAKNENTQKVKQVEGFVFVVKISAAEIGWDQNDIKALFNQKTDVGKVERLFKVYGTVNDVKSGTGTNGDWLKFIGGFEAQNLATGEYFRSAKLFLPDAVAGVLESELLFAQQKEGFLGLAFSYEVQAECTGKLIGYQFKVKNLLQKKAENDQLLAMREMFGDKKQLNAPAEK